MIALLYLRLKKHLTELWNRNAGGDARRVVHPGGQNTHSCGTHCGPQGPHTRHLLLGLIREISVATQASIACDIIELSGRYPENLSTPLPTQKGS
jgi:hypothetical protein